ncbi:methyltransferase domain-containing protein [candidate division WOR-3 bacterium]|nr:methyltransferase domain-containing protein [candidate division WOR-3 bacterium]
MRNQRINSLTQKQLEKAILEEKSRGTPDMDIGNKYGVNLRYIERVVTRAKGVNVSVFNSEKVVRALCPPDFKEEQTTVWSFKSRGSWATHSGEYRGNWSPYIPRNVILKYSKPGETVLDYFCGAGTTAVEAKLLGRKCIALDINKDAIAMAKKNLDFTIDAQQLRFIDANASYKVYEPELSLGDARNLSELGKNSVDLICAHPPYANIIQYTDHKEGDLSFCDIEAFLLEMKNVAEESYRVLKPARQCAILIGDTRRKKHVVPLGFMLIDVYLKAGFILRELVIKRQHNCKTTGFWYANSIKHNFLLLAHEYLPIFEKPIRKTMAVGEKAAKYDEIFTTLEKHKKEKWRKEFETTTVWLFPEKDLNRLLDENVIKRYYREGGYDVINLTSGQSLRKVPGKKQRNSLVYMKSPILEDGLTITDVEQYLDRLNAEIGDRIADLDRGGHLVIQTQDARVDGYIEPLAKRIFDMIKRDALSIREVVVVTTNDKSSRQSDKYCLSINHKYLLVYEMAK